MWFWHWIYIKYCIELYNNTRNGLHPDFSDRFHILENPPYNEKKIARRKLYGRSEEIYDNPSTILRIYAIRLDSQKEGEPPAFIVTGCGIKLTAQMRKMKELNQEINLMNSVQEWLANQGLFTKETLYNLNYSRHDE